MNLQEFKVATKEDLVKYGDKMPLGRQYDENNNLLLYKNSNGYWDEYTYDENNNVLTYKHSDGFWVENTYDDNNNKLSYKNSDGYWHESTYDENNNELTHKDSDGYWTESTYDENNNKLTYKDFDGIVSICLCNGIEYILWYDINTKNYIAGCQTLSYNKCIKYFDKNKDDYDDAELFMKAIEEHHKSLAYHLKICIIDTSKQIKENIMNIINYILVGGLASVIFGGGTFFGCLIAGFCAGALYNIIEEQMKKVAKEKEENGLTKPKE